MDMTLTTMKINKNIQYDKIQLDIFNVKIFDINGKMYYIFIEVKYMDEIIRLQKYLSLLRTTANWSVQEFADMLGVTRQTINNLEKKDPIKMSKVQYLAIRSLFTHEIENGNNKWLKIRT